MRRPLSCDGQLSFFPLWPIAAACWQRCKPQHHIASPSFLLPLPPSYQSYPCHIQSSSWWSSSRSLESRAVSKPFCDLLYGWSVAKQYRDRLKWTKPEINQIRQTFAPWLQAHIIGSIRGVLYLNLIFTMIKHWRWTNHRQQSLYNYSIYSIITTMVNID